MLADVGWKRVRRAILMQGHDVRNYTILIHRDADSDMYLVDVPDLPGIVTEGSTEGEAIANASDAIRGHLAFLQREGEAIPEPSYDARSVAVSV
jgi:predicted RNase H-like HicB family nuclease